MPSQSDWEQFVPKSADNVTYFTPKQDPIAGTALSDNPPRLFQPFQIRGLLLQNRILTAPMAQYSAFDGHATPWQQQHLGSIAVRGPGLTWTEATAVVPHGRTGLYDTGLWKESHIEAWRPTIDFVHSQGQKIGIQLAHSGRKGSQTPFSTRKVLPKDAGGFADELQAPSALVYAESHPVPQAMSVEQIHEAVAQWANATELAVRAGFDAINIHGGHGYLLHSFLSPISNHRTDRYGGSFENRVRFLVEVVDAMRANMPSSMPLFLRLSATDWLEKSRPDLESWKVEDTIRVAKLLTGKIDVLDVSSGGSHPEQKVDFDSWSDTPAGEAYQAQAALEIKRAVGDSLSVNAVGKVSTGQMAEELLERGVDLVAVGKPFLKNPGTVFKFADDLDVSVQMAVQHAYPFRIGWPGVKT